jgi:hypothetical protein
MVQIARGKCSHPQCGCSVPGTTEYCSEHCRTATSLFETCRCGHDGCIPEAGTPAIGEREKAAIE